MTVPAGCSCGGTGVCLACAIADLDAAWLEAFGEAYQPAEPTDEQVTRPTVYVPDSRHENDWTL